MAIPKLSSKSFKREIASGRGRVVVDFYADWCGPCHQVAPVLEGLSSKLDGTVRFVKVDIDESPDIARSYGIISIPTVILFEDGEARSRVTGAAPAHVMERELDLATAPNDGDRIDFRA